jgi:predicted nucleotidyltransferase
MGSPKIDNLQQTVLARCAEWADAHPSVAAICVFGSVARGDYGPKSDVDIFVRPELDDANDISLIEDFTQLHQEGDGFAILLGQEVGRTVHIHGMVLVEPEDHAWPAISAARKMPVATRGKAMLVATPKWKSAQPHR